MHRHSVKLAENRTVFTVADRPALASRPALSRFFKRMYESSLEQFDQINRKMRQILYSIKKPEKILFDLDSTLLIPSLIYVPIFAP